MTDKHAVQLYESQLERHRSNARSSLEEALRRVKSALQAWDAGPSPLNVSSARHAVQYAAEGYAELQAFVALKDMSFLMVPTEGEAWCAAPGACTNGPDPHPASIRTCRVREPEVAPGADGEPTP